MEKRKRISKDKSRVHSLACHDSTWEKFLNFRKKHGLTYDKMINVLIDRYNTKDVPNEIHYLKELRGVLDNQIKSLE